MRECCINKLISKHAYTGASTYLFFNKVYACADKQTYLALTSAFQHFFAVLRTTSPACWRAQCASPPANKQLEKYVVSANKTVLICKNLPSADHSCGTLRVGTLVNGHCGLLTFFLNASLFSGKTAVSMEIHIFEKDYEPAFASQHDKDSASFFKVKCRQNPTASKI